MAIPIYSQSNPNEEKHQRFLFHQKKAKESNLNLEHNGLQALKNAQTPYEFSYSYYILGVNKFRQGEYANAVNLLESAEHFGNQTDSTRLKRDYTLTLLLAYRRAGLIMQSNEALDREKKLIDQSNDPYKEAETHYILSKINDIDEKYCQSAIQKEKYLNLIPPQVRKKDLDFIFAVYAQLAFAQLKCRKTEEAKKTISKADQLISQIPSKNPTLSEILELSKALVLVEENQKEQALKLFNKAYQTSKKNGTKALTKQILEESLKSEIDPATIQTKILHEINDLTKKESEVSKDLTLHESKKELKKLQSQKTKITAWMVYCIASIVLISIYILYKTRTAKKRRKRYEELRDRLNREENQSSENTISEKEKAITTPTNLKKELDNEAEILQRLEAFERENLFTELNFSATKMATILQITPRNLGYFLKKYRGEDFYSYLNSVRIDYISKELKKNPQLLKYKIAVISEMAGYSSHTQFAINFKAKNGISPSQYINYLKEEKTSENSNFNPK